MVPIPTTIPAVVDGAHEFGAVVRVTGSADSVSLVPVSAGGEGAALLLVDPDTTAVRVLVPLRVLDRCRRLLQPVINPSATASGHAKPTLAVTGKVDRLRGVPILIAHDITEETK